MKRKLGELRYTEDPLSVLKSLAGKDPVQILLSVYETCSLYLNQIQRRKLTDFFQWAIQNQAVRHIFLLSIYKGAYSADKLMPSFFEEEQRSHAMAEVYPQQQQQMLYKSDGKWRREGGREGWEGGKGGRGRRGGVGGGGGEGWEGEEGRGGRGGSWKGGEGVGREGRELEGRGEGVGGGKERGGRKGRRGR